MVKNSKMQVFLKQKIGLVENLRPLVLKASQQLQHLRYNIMIPKVS